MMCSVKPRFRGSRHQGILLVLLGMLLLAGCSLPLGSSPPQQAFLLETGTFTPLPARRATGKTLLVAVPEAAPGFDSNRIAYTREPLKLDYYNNSVWSDTPAKMLLPILVHAFETTGAFKAVISPPAPVLADLRIDVRVIRLQHELLTQPGQVRLTIRMEMVDIRKGQALGTQVFEAVEPVASEDAYGAARAANNAVRKVLADLLPFALQYAS